MQIDVNLTRTAEDLITELGAGAKLYLYSSPTGLTTTWTEVSGAAQLLVAGTERYELIDPTGSPGTTWYKAVAGGPSGAPFAGDVDVTDTGDPDYIEPFRSGSLLAYATVDDVTETMSLPDESRYNLLADLLVDVSMAVDNACGRQFYRSPQVTGTETFYVDVIRSGMSSLVFANGSGYCADGKPIDLVSVTNLYVRDSESGSYVELTQDTDFFLAAGNGPGAAGIDWPYEDVDLSTVGSRTCWPVGRRAVKVIGVRGFPKVPMAVKRGVVSEARNRYRQGVGTGGDASSNDDTEWLRIMFPPYVRRSYASV